MKMGEPKLPGSKSLPSWASEGFEVCGLEGRHLHSGDSKGNSLQVQLASAGKLQVNADKCRQV